MFYVINTSICVSHVSQMRAIERQLVANDRTRTIKRQLVANSEMRTIEDPVGRPQKGRRRPPQDRFNKLELSRKRPLTIASVPPFLKFFARSFQEATNEEVEKFLYIPELLHSLA